MEKLIDKFGRYDLFSILMPGMITLMALDSIYRIYQERPLFLRGDKLLIFLLGGYFCGILLHEIVGHIEGRLEYYSSGYYAKENSNIIDSYEKPMIACIQKHITKDDNSAEDMKRIQSVCVNDLQINGKNGRADSLKTSSEMAHALCYAMCFLEIINLYFFVTSKSLKINSFLIITIVVIPAAILLCMRSRRMHKYYLRYLFRTYAILHNLMPK